MIREEFKVTKEMKENQDFSFVEYVYENTSAVYVHEDSLQFLDEYRNLTNSVNTATYFTICYKEIEYIIY